MGESRATRLPAHDDAPANNRHHSAGPIADQHSASFSQSPHGLSFDYSRRNRVRIRSTNDGGVGDPLGPSTRRAVRVALDDIDEQARLLTVREAVYDGVFSTPKTEAGTRRIPLSDTALTLIAEWKAHVEDVSSQTLWCSRRAQARLFCRTTWCAASSSRHASGWGFLEQRG